MGDRSEPTCIAHWNSASVEGTLGHEPSHLASSASSLNLKVGGWTCGPVFEIVESQNPPRGRCARQRTAGRLAVSREASPLVRSPTTQIGEVSAPTRLRTGTQLPRAEQQQRSPLPDSWQNCFVFLFYSTLAQTNQLHHNPLLLISRCLSQRIRKGQESESDKRCSSPEGWGKT